MFGSLARLVTRRPLVVIVTWLVAVTALTAFGPTLRGITQSGQENFLPADYQSVRALRLADRSFGSGDESNSVLVFWRGDGKALTEADQKLAASAVNDLNARRPARVLGVETGAEGLAKDRSVLLAQASFQGRAGDRAVQDAVADLRTAAHDQTRGGPLKAAVTGGPAVNLDSRESSAQALAVISIATVALILILLLVVFRAPLAAILPILVVLMLIQISSSLIALAGEAAGFAVQSDLETTLTVVLFGLGTDYYLFLLFRFRERLRAGDDRRAAAAFAAERVGPAVASAGAVVAVAFGALSLASYEGFRSLAPALVISVVVTVAAALTLVPALLSLTGAVLLWPSKAWRRTERREPAAALGGRVTRRPGLIAGGAAVLLLSLAGFVVAFEGDYDSYADLPRDTQSHQGLEQVKRGFALGAIDPAKVYLKSQSGGDVDRQAAETYARQVSAVDGVGGVGPPQFSKEGDVAVIDVILTGGPLENRTLDRLDGPLGAALHAAAPTGTDALVGGTTQLTVDGRSAINRDLGVVLPVAALAIAVILLVLLRGSVVAPLYLMAVVLLGVAATAGATVLVFQVLAGRPGVSAQIPVILYLFVVAIGTDYNILVIARLREEAAREGTRGAVAAAVGRAGPVVAAAGLVLAGSFASLMFAGVPSVVQLGFAVAIGIVLAAFMISILLVPALTVLVGGAAWWPRGRAKQSGAAE